MLITMVKVFRRSENYRQKSVEFNLENARLTSALYHEREQALTKIETLQQAHQQLTETFQNLSNQALLNNNQAFLSLAQSSFEKFFAESKTDLDQRQQSLIKLVDPVQKSLEQVDQKIGLLEKERIDAYSDLRRQVGDLLSSQKELRSETANLVKALRTPTTRGQWGEIQLRRVVEMAGMISHCDFIEQAQGDEGRLRPDMVINLPGGRKIIVDAKTPLSAYLESIEANDDHQRRGFLDDHARQVRTHIRSLSQRAYWEQFQPTPDFVVMFLPGEAFFSAALEKDPSLIEAGVQERVILATPTTLIALLRAVSFGWRQENIAENARSISELGRELYKRLSDMNESLGRLGRHIRQVVDSYNQTIGTVERRVLVSARKLNELDPSLDSKGLEALNPLDSIPRSVQSVENL
ncbi:DNA recombination protein RmuC [Candidatus Finniella inopinata]|uniref:DNA recombination protein RmuC homolog n=2 Tax=Candidatus Finniella inopinata TaxID=1696036 RepID=A0A4Q7DGH4_9PROT|nr:DNA recombination protein RmuC [Candidatus Finniella inopinata]